MKGTVRKQNEDRFAIEACCKKFGVFLGALHDAKAGFIAHPIALLAAGRSAQNIRPCRRPRLQTPKGGAGKLTGYYGVFDGHGERFH